MRPRIAAAIRALVEHAVTANVPDEQAERVAADIEKLDAHFQSFPRRAPRSPALPDLTDIQASFSGDPIIGEANPMAPPVHVLVDGELIRGAVRLGDPYEGPPGYVHGAVVAGIFDMLLGLANIASGNPGMTGTLTIRYLLPTPLHTDLAFEAKTKSVDGRKIYTAGALYAGETLTAEADGLFVSVTGSRSESIFSERLG
ncbi:MAG: PaaI family thioesterase [Actinomycetota bacterium]